MKIDFSVLQAFVETVFTEAGLPFAALSLSLEDAKSLYDKVSVTWYHHPATPLDLPGERKEASLSDVVFQVYQFLKQEDISITKLGITAYLSSPLFDCLDEHHPDRVDLNSLRKIINIEGIDCYIQVLRKFDQKDLSH